MQIRRTTQLNSTQNLNFKSASKTKSTSQVNSAPVDQFELSAEAKMLTQTGDIRHERVAHIRAQIANGQYETPEKIDAAVERMLDEFA